MAELVGVSVRGYRDIALMWVRAALVYPASFWMMAGSQFFLGLLDFVGIWIMFHTIDSLGGFDLSEIAFLYGATAFGLGVADLVGGQVERLGQLIRMGRLDSMLLKPLPLLVQVCADQFALRRVARITQALVVLGVAAYWIDWTPAKLGLTLVMLASGSLIFLSLFVVFGCIQFWTRDASEVANAFTYGGNTLTQYPLTIFPKEVVTGLTFLVPLAFVNWYPSLYILDRTDPYGFPEWLRYASPLAALALVAVTAVGLAGRRPALRVDGELMALIEVQDLQRTFAVRRKAGRFRGRREDVVAVHDLSFAVEAGEMVGYIGPERRRASRRPSRC